MFDLFFNAETGYRGAFFRSPYDGLRISAYFIEVLKPVLLARPLDGAIHIDPIQSLSGVSAKLWLAEVGKGERGCPGCKGEWKRPSSPTTDIYNDRWEIAPEVPAADGRMAPYLTQVRIFGAFVDDRNNEFIPAQKRTRAEQIHRFGWS